MTQPRKELIGYASRLSVQPGDSVDFMVSSEFDEYEVEIIRLIHGDTDPDGPGFKADVVDIFDEALSGSRQETPTGSYIRVDEPPDLSSGFTVQTWIWPTTPDLGRLQGLITRWSPGSGGFGLFVDEDGRLAFKVSSPAGEVKVLTADQPLRSRQWYFVAAVFDPEAGEARLSSRMHPAWPIADSALDITGPIEGFFSPEPTAPLLIGAGWLENSNSFNAQACYNGKIEAPKLFDRALTFGELEAVKSSAGASPGEGLVASWDFAATDHSSTTVRDVVGDSVGRVINFPSRAMHGHNWAASVYDPAEAPEQYGAIHFHDDDMDDCRWDVDFTWEVPKDLRSGCYAALVRAGEVEDHIPFFVRPPDGESTADVLFLIPTNTYLAYANERIIFSEGMDFSGLTNIPIVIDPYDLFLKEHPEYGGSIYDVHSDGSGIAYSHYLRPIVSMRPTHRHWVTNGPRHFPFDLYMIDWLEEKGIPYDVVVDEDLHREGVQLLERYKVVVTASHPEYWTEEMLDALEVYLNAGGRLMYLGGNGFYWVTAFDPERNHIIEVRRGFSGTRAWESHPGEVHLATTGELGGIWRHRGRPPNQLVGVGFTAQGWDLNTPGYVRLDDSEDRRAAFIFEGVGVDEVIGDFGLVMNGAAGDELDRIEPALGSPPHALRLATTEGRHSDYYLICHEEQAVTVKEIHGTDNPRVRADMVYFETPGDGAVFSVGSINWFSSLSHNNYENNVSRITENVLRKFMS